jgi:antitoxin HicB
MKESGTKKAGLARRLGISKSQIERLLDLTHASRLEQIEQRSRRRLMYALN